MTDRYKAINGQGWNTCPIYRGSVMFYLTAMEQAAILRFIGILQNFNAANQNKSVPPR